MWENTTPPPEGFGVVPHTIRTPTILNLWCFVKKTCPIPPQGFGQAPHTMRTPYSINSIDWNFGLFLISVSINLLYFQTTFHFSSASFSATSLPLGKKLPRPPDAAGQVTHTMRTPNYFMFFGKNL